MNSVQLAYAKQQIHYISFSIFYVVIIQPFGCNAITNVYLI